MPILSITVPFCATCCTPPPVTCENAPDTIYVTFSGIVACVCAPGSNWVDVTILLAGTYQLTRTGGIGNPWLLGSPYTIGATYWLTNTVDCERSELEPRDAQADIGLICSGDMWTLSAGGFGVPGSGTYSGLFESNPTAFEDTFAGLARCYPISGPFGDLGSATLSLTP